MLLLRHMTSQTANESAPTDAPLLLVQLSDCHLLADPAGTKREVPVLDNLKRVIAHIGATTTPDVLLVTGDIAHDGSAAAYGHFRQALASVNCALRVLPGNRDQPATMQETLGDWCDPVLDLGEHWRVVMLDSTVPQARHGHLSGQQFALLDEAVATAGERHILVAMHHNPVVDMGDSLDTAMLGNARILLTHMTAWPQARVLLWGHIHRAYDCRVDSMRLLAAPATSFQYTVRDGAYEIDPIDPGYRWIKLYSDGSIATGVRRVSMQG